MTTIPAFYTVEFYSPYCGHCRKFAPTWKSLTLSGFDETHDRFTFAQVDCVTNGDACAAQKITGYPTMWLYKEGKQIEEYTASRNVEDILQWLDKRVDKRDVVVDPIVPPVQLPHERAKDKEGALVQEAQEQNHAAQVQDHTHQPEQVQVKAEAAKPPSGPQRLTVQQRSPPPTANGSVIALDQTSFDALRKPEAGPLFVKLYV